jgi:hypothetical protein
MRPFELFGVVVRSVGLLLVLSAAWVLFWAMVNLLLGGPGNVAGMLVGGIPVLLVGIWLLRGGSNLAARVYPQESEDEERP